MRFSIVVLWNLPPPSMLHYWCTRFRMIADPLKTVSIKMSICPPYWAERILLIVYPVEEWREISEERARLDILFHVEPSSSERKLINWIFSAVESSKRKRHKIEPSSRRIRLGWLSAERVPKPIKLNTIDDVIVPSAARLKHCIFLSPALSTTWHTTRQFPSFKSRG